MLPVRSITNTTSTFEETCPQLPRQAVARRVSVLPLSNPRMGANQYSTVPEALSWMLLQRSPPNGLHRCAGAPGRRDHATEIDLQPAGREGRVVRHGDRAGIVLRGRSRWRVEDGQELCTCERTQVDGRLDHVAFVAEPRKVQDRGG
jgi:hypothetical protein